MNGFKPGPLCDSLSFHNMWTNSDAQTNKKSSYLDVYVCMFP